MWVEGHRGGQNQRGGLAWVSTRGLVFVPLVWIFQLLGNPLMARRREESHRCGPYKRCCGSVTRKDALWEERETCGVGPIE